MGIDARALGIARECKGFLAEEEGLRLYELARASCGLGPVLEIGSYCGKSSVYLGSGARDGGGRLICVDHHRGSEEHQVGEGYHDPDLYDPESGRVDSLAELRRTLHRAGLEPTAVLIVTDSETAASLWQVPLGMVFIDGGHSLRAARADYRAWARKLAPGGILAIHDLFFDPSEGGQAPVTIYREALGTGRFERLETTRTLGVLRLLG